MAVTSDSANQVGNTRRAQPQVFQAFHRVIAVLIHAPVRARARIAAFRHQVLNVSIRTRYAIHGTIYGSRLGHRASHGCVRLLPENAAILFSLVEQEGIEDTRIMVEH